MFTLTVTLNNESSDSYKFHRAFTAIRLYEEQKAYPTVKALVLSTDDGEQIKWERV